MLQMTRDGELKQSNEAEYIGVFVHEKEKPFDINDKSVKWPFYAANMASVIDFLKNNNHDLEIYNIVITKFRCIVP